jgi:hypothetical protein
MSLAAVERDRAGWERLSASLKPEGHAFISGRALAAGDGRLFDDVSPIDGRRICAVARCGPADVAAVYA